MEKVKITKIFLKTVGKDGKPLLNKNNKPYKMLGILTDKYADRWYSCYIGTDSQPEMTLKEGQEVELKLETKQNGQYTNYNFSLPSETDKLEQRVKNLEDFARKYAPTLKVLYENTTSDGKPMPNFEKVVDITPEQIPF